MDNISSFALRLPGLSLMSSAIHVTIHGKFHITALVYIQNLDAMIVIQSPPVGIIFILLEQKLVLISAGTNIIRFVPPLVIEKADVDEMMKRLRAAAAE